MRMFSPSPGECCDRVTILKLKIQHSDKASFREELDLISSYLQQHLGWQVPDDLLQELVKINSRLWDLEDTQRKLLKENWEIDHFDNEMSYDSFCRNAVTIVQLNDARAATVQKINAACNVNAPEKLHK